MKGGNFMKMIVTTSKGERYEREIVSVNFVNGNLLICYTDGTNTVYNQESLQGEDSKGFITII